MKRLEGKVAMVTGAGRVKGIGASCAIRLASEGASIIITDLESSELNDVVDLITNNNVSVLPVFADLTSEKSVTQLINRAKEEYGGIDILVNNAGGSPGPAPLAQFTVETWEKTVAINLTATFLCCREVVPLMIEKGGGKIINISSRAARRGPIWMHAYSAAKAGVLGLTYSMAVELAPFNICVNALCPGDIDTELKQWGLEMEARAKGLTVDDLRKEISAATPLGRLGRPEDVASAVAFFATSDSDYLTGEVINLTGGHGLGNATVRPVY